MTTFVTPAPEVTRDRYGRPLIVPPDGGKPVAYTRATTIADTIDDRYNLELWKCRQTALGLADREDLLLGVAAHRDDKKQLNKLVASAIEAAKSSAGATTGTALHALSELVDAGRELPVLPDTALADLAAYREATAALSVQAVEQFVVLDDVRVAGTADRIVEHQGRRYIADLKTGRSVSYAMGSIAQQLAIYAHGEAYDVATGQRSPLDVDQEWAIVVHLPAGTGECVLHWVNIAHGWEAVQLSMRVRAYRNHARKGLSTQMS